MFVYIYVCTLIYTYSTCSTSRHCFSIQSSVFSQNTKSQLRHERRTKLQYTHKHTEAVVYSSKFCEQSFQFRGAPAVFSQTIKHGNLVTGSSFGRFQRKYLLKARCKTLFRKPQKKKKTLFFSSKIDRYKQQNFRENVISVIFTSSNAK